MNNEPAFPHNEKSHNGSHFQSHEGMTLRDYFAARALSSGVARESVPEYDLRAMFGPNRTGIRREEIMAADAYRIADAMLKARDAVSSQKEPS